MARVKEYHMYLPLEKMIPFIHNALETEIDDQGRLRFRRFSDEQVHDYGLDGEAFPVRCRASANVTLDLMTDASWIGFEYDLLPGSSQTFYSIDLFVDQVLYATRSADDFKSSGLLFELPEGVHRITVFMPWTAEIMIRNLAISDHTVLKKSQPKKLRILTIGDSITQGYIARIAAHYPQITVIDDSHYPHTPDFYAPDYLHPNDAGFLIHGEQIVRAIEQRYQELVR